LNKLVTIVRSSVPASERPPYFEVFHEDEDTTESVDLSSVFTEDLTLSGSFSFVGITKTWFGKLLQALPIPALLIDEEFKVSFANRAATKIGASCSALRGAPFSSFFPDPTAAAEAQSFAERVFATRKPETYQSVLEFDKRRTWGRISFRAVRMGSNRCLLLLVEDLTHEKEQLELQKQLLHAQKMEAVGVLAGGIAHDFNNLLTVIMGFSELLSTNGNIDEQVRADLRKIHRASVHGSDLVNGLLTFSRKGEVQPRLLNLNDQIEQLNRLLSRVIPKMIDIELDLSAGLDLVNADPGQIEQVLMNLAVNARDAMPEGGRLVIQTANVNHDTEQSESPGDKRGRFVMLSVSDTGHGMDQETQERIFEPFFTTKEKGRGTGLGLAIAYGIVQQHGGCIECESFPGVGATFRIFWPAAEGEPVPEWREEPAITPGGTETVLLVDDEDAVRDLGKAILEEAGYEVIQAANGAEALRICQKQGRSIALVILDLIMPGMSGKECLQELVRRHPGVKILISSGYPSGEISGDAIQTNAAGFVNKPYSMGELLRAVRSTLDGA
jgi:PAS domain S-box-containing protein